MKLYEIHDVGGTGYSEAQERFYPVIHGKAFQALRAKGDEGGAKALLISYAQENGIPHDEAMIEDIIGNEFWGLT